MQKKPYKPSSNITSSLCRWAIGRSPLSCCFNCPLRAVGSGEDMEMNSVLLKVSPRGRRSACRDPRGQEQIEILSCRAIATLSLESDPLGEEPQGSLKNATAPSRVGPLWLLSAWANSGVAALLGQGKGQEGRRRPILPCQCVSYGYYFLKRPVSPSVFPIVSCWS